MVHVATRLPGFCSCRTRGWTSAQPPSFLASQRRSHLQLSSKTTRLTVRKDEAETPQATKELGLKFVEMIKNTADKRYVWQFLFAIVANQMKTMPSKPLLALQLET